MAAAELLALSEREIRERGLWPDPDDAYADVSVVDGPTEISITAAYDGALDDSPESRRQLEYLLFRRLNFVYHGGLIARVPDAAGSGKDLVIVLLLPDDEIPEATREVLEEYHAILGERGIGLRVIQVPRETL
jgi:hypothetical protein